LSTTTRPPGAPAADRPTPRAFSAAEALPFSVFEQITDVRVQHPRWILKEARQRRRRPRLTENGKLVLLALDHPGRGVNQIRGDALAMGNRHELLARARRVFDDPGLDGVMGTSDVLDELLILSHLERRRTGKGFLDGRVLVGSMNRGGLQGAAFEMEDTFTSFTAERLADIGAEGGKMMYRLDPQDPASGRTILACAQAINELGRRGLAAFLEPLGVAHAADGYHPAKDASTLIRQCGIGAALGESSAHLWIKFPYGEGFERVARATTLPILLLGGPARENPLDTLGDFARGMAAGANVRGAIIGRNLLFPGDGDPLPMCRALTRIVHHGASLEDAAQVLAEEPRKRGRRAAPRKK
jgi:DhnA family fructose-bisphosphate aldolase class Ia